MVTATPNLHKLDRFDDYDYQIEEIERSRHQIAH